MNEVSNLFNKSIILPSILSVVGAVIAGFILHEPPRFIVIWCLLALLYAIVVCSFLQFLSLNNSINSLIRRVSPLTTLANVLFKSLNELLKSLRERCGGDVITVRELRNFVGEINFSLSEAERKELFTSRWGGSDISKYEREKYLLEKAKRGEITDHREAEELVKLLEEERAKCEARGDILMAIQIGAVIFFVLSLLAHLLQE